MNEEKMRKILSDWEMNWKSEQEQQFKDIFLDTYYGAKTAKEKNKKRNFRAKTVFLMVIILGIVLMICLLIIGLANRWKISDCIFAESFALLMIVLIAGLVSKWIDIMMYQETWARHSIHVHQMENEVIKYVYCIEPYNNVGDKNILFMRTVLKIWDDNQQKFSENMQLNERKLMDYFKNISKFV
ncbi:hypothetical protein [Agathobacter sp.]